MNCRDYSEALAEFVDGALDPARQRELERHVEGCPACRALLSDLKSIQAAAFTLERPPMPPGTLAAVQARLAAERVAARPARLLTFPQSRAAVTAWLTAAAALLVVTTAGIVSVIGPVPAHQEDRAADVAPANPADAVASIHAELQAATGHYEKAIAQLEQIARTGDGTLDPQVAEVFERNLKLIDQAIGESRAALQSQPASADVQEGLFDALRSKVALLQQSVELINEMRKGNQAEAGRLMQGLNQ